MPLYEYGCASCGGHLERRQGFQEAPLTVCPSCGGTLYRVLQPVGVVFKGSGWYCTDHRPAKSEKAGEGDKLASAPSKAEKPKAATTA